MRRRRRRVPASQGSFAFQGLASSRFWQPRFYDFNVHSAKKRREKLDYMHRNPVTRGLVKDPKDWVWSSYASHARRGAPLVTIDFLD
jgi:putative transposase